MREEEFDFIYNYLSENKIISEEALCELLKNITLSNAKMLEEIITLEMIKTTKEQEKEQQVMEQQLQKIKEQELAQKTVVLQEETVETNQEETVETNHEETQVIDIEYLLSVLGEKYTDRYLNAKELTDKSINITDSLLILTKPLSPKTTWKEMLSRYEALTSTNDKMTLVLYDIKNNIIPNIDNLLIKHSFDKRLFNLLKEMINYYKNLELELVEKEIPKEEPYKNYITCLNILNKESELSFLENVDILINDLLSLKEQHPEFYSDEIKNLIQNLIKNKKFYTDSVELFVNDNELEYSNLMNLYYEEMKKDYEKINKKYNEILYQIENNPEELLEISKTFYNEINSQKISLFLLMMMVALFQKLKKIF